MTGGKIISVGGAKRLDVKDFDDEERVETHFRLCDTQREKVARGKGRSGFRPRIEIS